MLRVVPSAMASADAARVTAATAVRAWFRSTPRSWYA